MKCRVILSVDTQTGEYEMEFQRVDQPGAGIEYSEISPFLRACFGDFDQRLESERAAAQGNAADDEVVEIHLFGDDYPLN